MIAYAIINQALAQALRYDESTCQHLAQLTPQCVQIQLTQPDYQFYLELGQQGLHLAAQSCLPCAGRIEANSLDVLKIACAQDRAQALQQYPIQLNGNTQVLMAVQKVLGHLHIDWEALLADHLGETAGYWAAHSGRSLFQHARRHGLALRDIITQYLQHESGLLACGAQMAQLRTQIEQAHHDAQHLAEQIRQLRQRNRSGDFPCPQSSQV